MTGESRARSARPAGKRTALDVLQERAVPLYQTNPTIETVKKLLLFNQAFVLTTRYLEAETVLEKLVAPHEQKPVASQVSLIGLHAMADLFRTDIAQLAERQLPGTIYLLQDKGDTDIRIGEPTKSLLSAYQALGALVERCAPYAAGLEITVSEKKMPPTEALGIINDAMTRKLDTFRKEHTGELEAKQDTLYQAAVTGYARFTNAIKQNEKFWLNLDGKSALLKDREQDLARYLAGKLGDPIYDDWVAEVLKKEGITRRADINAILRKPLEDRTITEHKLIAKHKKSLALERRETEEAKRQSEIIINSLHLQMNYQEFAKAWHEFSRFSEAYSQPHLNILEENERSLERAYREVPVRAQDVPPEQARPIELEVKDLQ